MRGNYPHNYKEGGGKKPYLWILVAFLVLFFAKGVVSGVASTVTTPFYFVRHYIETSSATVPTFFRARMELISEIQKLEAEILAQRGKDAAFAFTKEENEELRNLFQASSTPQILAGVISRPPYTPYDTLIVDKGGDDGVVQYAPVYFGNKMAVGYVRSVFSQSSLVTLFSSPDAESTVYVFGPNIFTPAYGEGGGVVRLSIPQGMPVEKGNVVVLPSLEGGIMGLVDHVRSVPTEPEQHAYVLFDIPLQSIRVVSIGTVPIRPITYEDASEEVKEAERNLFTFEVPVDAEVASTTETNNATSGTSTLP